MPVSGFKQYDYFDTVFRNSKGKEKQAPQLPCGIAVADSHCHLNMLDHPELALARAAHYGFNFVCCLVDTAEPPSEDGGVLSAAQAYEALAAWRADARRILGEWGEGQVELPRVRFACGVHPHNARYWDGAKDELVELLKNPLTGCLGEIGLDYHYDFSPRDVQREVFATQLRLAHETQLPVSLHLREAHDDALEILRREGVPAAGCIVHCFNLDAEVLAPFVELGCYIAFGGPLTFRKAYYTRAAAVHVPLDRLLTETDAPYMAPEPLRGTLCAPDHTLFTLRTLLDCFGYAGEERALELMRPRAIDVENGAESRPADSIDFARLQGGLDEAQFCNKVDANAVALLDRAPTAWQLGA